MQWTEQLRLGGAVGVWAEHAHPSGLELDRDAALALNVHVVKELLLQVALRHRLRHLQETVRERRLPVVDVRNNTEVPHLLRRHLPDDGRKGKGPQPVSHAACCNGLPTLPLLDALRVKV
jgi:hypothetical protein